MMREVIAGVVIGLTVCGAFIAGRASKDDPPLYVGKTYQLLPPEPQPAVNLISCDKSALHASLEHLRVCRARFKSELVK